MSDSKNTGAEIKLICFYGRVSTSNQENQKTIQNQIMELESLADEKYGKGNYKVVKQYLDEGWSGSMLARPQLDQLREDAKRDLWSDVLIYDPDRLARNYAYQELVLDELTEANKKVLFKTTPTPNNAEEKILHGVRGLFSEYERAKITERFRLGKLRKAKNKHVIASEAPFGYSLVPRQGRPGDPNFVETHYVINEKEARVARMIFDWVGNKGMSLRKVVRLLQEQGILPRKSKRGVWNTSTLSSMLRNETYIGNGHYGASYAVTPLKPFKKEGYKRNKKTSRRMKPKADWFIIPTPIILEGERGKVLFADTQRQLRDNFLTSHRNKKNQYLLAERIRCKCGCTRTGEGPQKGKYLYYRCSNRVKNHPLPPTCSEKGIRVSEVDVRVWTKLTQLMTSRELILAQLKRWNDLQREKIKNVAVDTETLRKEVTRIRKQELRYKVAYGEGTFSLAELVELTSPLKKQVAELEAQIAKVQTLSPHGKDDSVFNHRDVGRLVIDTRARLNDLSFEQKRDIVLDVIDGIIGVPGKLVVSGFIPVTATSPTRFALSPGGMAMANNYVEYKTSDRHRRAPQRGEVDSL